jgi:hypothetical protein
MGCGVAEVEEKWLLVIGTQPLEGLGGEEVWGVSFALDGDAGSFIFIGFGGLA